MGFEAVLYEVNITTQMDAIYLYGPTGKIAKKVNDITEYYHTDHLGSTRLVTSENGTVTEEIKYEPFGEQISTSEEKYTFNGKERDESGLYYYGARYYDPLIGRFLTRDSVSGEKEVPQTLNKYLYCLNNPLKYIDPSGNQPDDSQGAVEELFNRLRYLSPEALAKIQEEVNNGEITVLEALEKIVELLGFTVLWKDSDKNMLGVKISDDLTINVRLKPDLKNERGQSVYGLYKSKTAFIDFEKTGNVGDMALIFLHETSHAVLEDFGLGTPKEEQIIYSVEFSYMMASRLTGVNAPYSSIYMRNAAAMCFTLDSAAIYQPSIPEILQSWFPLGGHPIA